jgi:hypothetical protein
MTKLPKYHPVCGHRVGAGYTGSLDITTNQTVQNDTETQAIDETVEKDMVEGGVMGSVKASLLGASSSVTGYLKGRETTADKEGTTDIERHSETRSISQTVHIETVDTVEAAEKLGCQDPECPYYTENQKIDLTSEKQVSYNKLSERIGETTETQQEQHSLNDIDIQSEAEFDWADELKSDRQVDDPESRETDEYAVTGLGDNIAEEDKLENVIQANQNDPDHSDKYTVTGLGDDINEETKQETSTNRNTRETDPADRSVNDGSSENNDDRNNHDTDRTRGRR